MNHYASDPSLQDSADLSSSERFARWFIRETGSWLVPLVGYAVGGLVLYAAAKSVSTLNWSLIRIVILGA